MSNLDYLLRRLEPRDETDDPLAAVRAAARAVVDLDHAILDAYDAGIPVGRIAAAANLTRQGVHYKLNNRKGRFTL